MYVINRQITCLAAPRNLAKAGIAMGVEQVMSRLTLQMHARC